MNHLLNSKIQSMLFSIIIEKITFKGVTYQIKITPDVLLVA